MKGVSKKSIFLISSILILLFWQLYENKKVEVCIRTSKENRILTMPLKDRDRLEYFFREMIILECGGYTLFGCKPMHLNGYCKPFLTSDWRLFLDSIVPPQFRMYRGWKTWQKYKNFFENSACLLLSEKDPFKVEPNPATSILLINKQKFIDTVNNHIQDFQNVLKKESISGEDLLSESKNNPTLKTVLQCHDGLIGTLLGYGRDNAWLFEKRKYGQDTPLEFLWEKEIYDRLSDGSWLSYWWWLGIFPEDLSEYLTYPSFLADLNSIETKKLKQEFLETREKILKYYKNKDFLEATLTLFIEGAPQ